MCWTQSARLPATRLWRLNSVQKTTLKIFDAHCDTLSLEGDLIPADKGRFDVYTQVYAIWGDRHCNFRNCTLPLLEKYHAAGSPGILAIEGAHLLDCDPALLKQIAEAGARILTLTWNNASKISGSCVDEPYRGLSELGKGFVKNCAALGVLVDVSHLSEAGFWDVAAISRMLNTPFIASHSNSKTLCDNPRNLTDTQYKAIARSGGVVGVCLHSAFLNNTETSTISDVIAHILHFLELDENAVGLGTDFDGGITPPTGLETISDLARLYEALINAAGETVADAVFYDNWNRIFER